MLGRAIALLLGPLLLAGCPDLVPRLRYPWIESTRLSLVEEELELELGAERARVRARLVFVGLGRASPLELAFPEDERDPPLEGFVARWRGERCQTRLERHRPGHLPLRRVSRWHRAVVDGPGRGERGAFEVEYRQRYAVDGRRRRLRYLIRTGAYWSGPLGALRARARASSPAGVRIVAATLDGRLPRAVQGGLGWELRDFEPREDLLLELAAP